MLKVCAKCGEAKALGSFYNNKRYMDGKSTYCKACHASSYYTKDHRRELSQRFRANNSGYHKEWNRANRDKRREYDKRWRSNNKDAVNAKNSSRFHRAKAQKPKWADMSKIREFYRNCPDGYHVDHIIPLRGETVSGLHVEENLQYLPALDNIKKSNLFLGE
jgi:hypothetical protein